MAHRWISEGAQHPQRLLRSMLPAERSEAMRRVVLAQLTLEGVFDAEDTPTTGNAAATPSAA